MQVWGDRSDMNDRRMLLRFGVSAVVYMLLVTGLGARLAFLHLGPHEGRRDCIDRLRQFHEDLRGQRGAIYDRGGTENILAVDLPVKDICADPSVVVASNAVASVASVLADRLGMDVDEIAIKLNQPDRQYVRLRRFAHEDLAEAIAEENLPGLFFRDANVRHYPYGDFMCHVLGFVNYEGVGSAGIEQGLDAKLKGRPGVVEGRLNALRQELYLERERYEPGKAGDSVELTIDRNIQHIVEKVVDDVMKEFNSQAAWSIVQRVKTGEILAMVSRPAFDLNRFYETAPEIRMNRAVAVNYEPGSTLKAATFAAALNEGIVTPETVFDCENGGWFYKGKVLRDSHAHGKLTVAEGLKQSSNILTAKVALMLGNDRLYSYLRTFGFGEKTGIDLPGEEAGIFHPPSKWYGISPTRIPIGQGIATTGLQILGLYCTIANNGYRMRPYVVRRVVDADGNVVHEGKPEVVARVIRPETAALMRNLLASVTDQGGTGRRARIDEMRVAGKTGTAQKPVAGGYSPTDYVASFVGFLPVEDPEIGIIVVVDNPKPLYYGGQVAAPAFASIASEVSRYLGIQVYQAAQRGR
jgi:cell division protein FtsI (penicillin-binding protein 3)